MSSSMQRDNSTISSGCWPFSNRAYLTACARLTNRPPNRPFCSCATHWPRPLRPMNTMLDKERHEGGSTSFTLVFLQVRERQPFREAAGLAWKRLLPCHVGEGRY